MSLFFDKVDIGMALGIDMNANMIKTQFFL